MEKNKPRMDGMDIRVEVGLLVGGPVTIEVDCDPAVIDLTDSEFEFHDRVRGSVEFQMVGHRVIATGTVGTSAETTCVRCLKPAKVGLSAHMRLIYEKNPELLKPESQLLGTEEDYLAYYNGEEIRPGPQLREALLAELPALPVCGEECRGLCPSCGADLNAGACGCTREKPEPDKSWKASLERLKDE